MMGVDCIHISMFCRSLLLCTFGLLAPLVVLSGCSGPDPLEDQIEFGILSQQPGSLLVASHRTEILGHYRLYQEGKEELNDYAYIPNLLIYAQETNSDVTLLIPTLREFFELGADVNAQTKDKLSAYHIACRIGEPRVTQLLKNAGADVNAKDAQGRNILGAMVATAPLSVLEQLISDGVKVDVVDNYGERPIDVAMRSRDLNVIKALHKGGAFVNRPEFFEKALSEKNIELARFLIAAGMDVNASLRDGRSALEMALVSNDVPMVQMLLAAGADVNACAANGSALLMIAPNAQLAQLLVDRGANVNVKDAQGKTPLMKAAKWNDARLVKTLLAKGVDVNAEVGNRVTKRNALSFTDSAEVKALLRDAGSKEVMSLNEAVSLLSRYRVIDEYEAGKFVENIFTGETHYNDSYRKISSEILYHLMLYRDGREKLSDYDYLGKILTLHGMKPKLELPLETLKAFIDSGAKVDGLAPSSTTPLRKAISNGNGAVAKLLIDAKADVNVKYKDGDTNLGLALYNSMPNTALALVKAGANVNQVTGYNNKESLLYKAASKGYEKLVNEMLKRGADVNLGQKSPLFGAVNAGSLPLVELFIQKGNDVNKLNKDGDFVCSPLQQAILNKDLAMVKLLVKSGANMNQVVKDNDPCGSCWAVQHSLLTYAIARNLDSIALHFISAGADVNLTAPIVLAAKNKKINIVEALLKAKAKLDLSSYGGNNALCYAVKNNDEKLAQLLIDNGASPNVSSIYGAPLDIAVKDSNVAIAKILIKAGAKVTAKYEDEDDRLIKAIRSRNTDMVNLLITAGANVKIKIEDHVSLLHYAAAVGNGDTIRLLVKAGLNVNAMLKHRAIYSSIGYHDEDATPLYIAAYRSSMEHKGDVIMALLEQGATPNAHILAAAMTSSRFDGRYEAVMALLKKGAKLDSGYKWMHCAVLSGDVRIVQYMIKKGINVNELDDNGNSPIRKAKISRAGGVRDIIRVLKAAGGEEIY